MESQMVASALGKSKPYSNPDPKKQPRSEGDKAKAAYHDGKRLIPNEREASRNNAHVCKSSGKPLWRYYDSHAGCRNADCKHVREQMKQTGILWGVLMHLARRGELSGHPIIAPDKIDGYLHAIREKNSLPTTGSEVEPIPNSGPAF